VKIPDAPALPLLPKCSDSTANLPTPEACLSGGVTEATRAAPILPTTTLQPIDSSLFPVKQEEKLPSLLADDENEDDFGEFLLDAVQWL
jgi:hypothetical protein